MDVEVPCPEDHLGLLIYVKLCHHPPTAAVPSSTTNASSQVSFNRIFERLRRVSSVVVSDSPSRQVTPNFVVSVAECKTNWAEFQQHRKIIGLICVGFLGNNNEQQINGCSSGDADTVNHAADDDDDDADDKKTVRCDEDNNDVATGSEFVAFSQILRQYQDIKEHYRSTLLDARCIVIGSVAGSSKGGGTENNNSCTSTATTTMTALDGILRYASLDDASELEHDVRDYVKALYWVLEGKRLDLSYEKLDWPPCPVAPDEEKYLVGLDRTSRAFRKRCIGRLKKQIADITLITGLPTLAVESYNTAIDQLKSTNDWLWLAGAYEGYACAAIIAKYGRANLESLASPSSSSTSLQRVPTFTPGEMKKAQRSRQHSPRNNSSLSSRRGAFVPALRSEGKSNNAVKLLITDADIEEKFRLAIENYQKFSFASCIECECAFKSTFIYLVDKRYDSLDKFLNINCARFLDENFRAFTDVQKGHICNLISAVYKAIGFRRKMAFFTRLSALFRLYLNRDDPLTTADYRQVYSLLVSSLDGYRIPWAGFGTPAVTSGGWPALQVRALHETYVSALRSQHKEAAIRHLAHIIQVALESPQASTDEQLQQFCSELAQLTNLHGTHNISTHLRLIYGAILPPIQLTKLPKFLCVDLKPLPAHLTPCFVPDSATAAIFIYSPFQNAGSQNNQVRWVCGCAGLVSLQVQNLLPVKLEVRNLVIVGEGVKFNSSSGRLELPPKSGPISIDLQVMPKEAGTLTVTGCSCEVLGVKSTCRFDDVPWLRRTSRLSRVEVLPPLPLLALGTTLASADNEKQSSTENRTVELTLYAGQKQIERIRLENESDVDIERMELDIQQPTVFGFAPLISLLDERSSSEQVLALPIASRTTRDISVCVTAVDPLGIEGESDEEKREASIREIEGAFDSIPYTGRVLTAAIKFSYCAGISSSKADSTVADNNNSSTKILYQRSCSLTIHVTILPVVVVIDWHVLPGETSKDRYIALDAVNATDYEVDVHFQNERRVTVQSKDACRVPILCECCDLTSIINSLFRGACSRHYLLESRRKFIIEHVSTRLKVSWNLTSNPDIGGDVPLGAVLTSKRLCKQLVMPRLMLDVIVSGAENGANDEYIAGVGDRVILTTSIVQSKRQGTAVACLRLQFFQDYQNGLTSPTGEDVLHFGLTTHLVNLGEDVAESCRRDFQFLFCNEGIYKVTVICDIRSRTPETGESDGPCSNNVEMEELLFGTPVMPVLLFNVMSRPDSEMPS